MALNTVRAIRKLDLHLLREIDHSFSHDDCHPYYLRTGDSWVPIDYSKHPKEWMHPLKVNYLILDRVIANRHRGRQRDWHGW